MLLVKALPVFCAVLVLARFVCHAGALSELGFLFGKGTQKEEADEEVG